MRFGQGSASDMRPRAFAFPMALGIAALSFTLVHQRVRADAIRAS